MGDNILNHEFLMAIDQFQSVLNVCRAYVDRSSHIGFEVNHVLEQLDPSQSRQDCDSDCVWSSDFFNTQWTDPLRLRLQFVAGEHQIVVLSVEEDL
eukprot:3938616-Rhodomonas_salina.1